MERGVKTVTTTKKVQHGGKGEEEVQNQCGKGDVMISAKTQ